MVRLLKLVVVLAVLAFAGLVGYAYLGDLTPTPQDVRQPVAIDAG
jgi:predicted small integral membrane protein